MNSTKLAILVMTGVSSLASLLPVIAQEPLELDETCTVTIGNQTAVVRPDGTFFVRNISVFQSRTTGIAPQLYRVRATCLRDGEQVTGQSDFFELKQGQIVFVDEVFPTALDPIPTNISVDSGVEFVALNETVQLSVTATLPDRSTEDVTARSSGTTYLSTNPRLLTVDENGLVTGRNSFGSQQTGTIAIINEGNITTVNITSVGPSDDFDNDGMPNDYEDLFGLNKFSNDANGDLDGDGLTNIEEFNLGTIPNNPDTDGDGIPDGQDNGPLQPESSPPQVTIVSPADGATVVEGQTIAFNVDAFDDGILTSVELSTDSGFSRTFTNPPFQDQIIVPIGIDEITFSVTATDGVPNVTTVIATLTVVPDPLTEIIGTVVDLEGNVVDGAQVTVIGLGDSASTDASGNFSIPDVRTVQGDFRLRIDANDQRALTDRFTFSLDGTTNVGRIILNPEGTSAGFEFALAFQRNNSTSALTLFISGDDATDGTVTIPGLGFTQGFSVTPGAVTSVAVPSGAAVTTTDGVQNLGIQVTSDDAPITVYGLNQQLATTDAYAAYPVLEGGARYRVMCYTPRTSAQTAIVAADDGTVLTVTPSVTVGSRTAGIPYQVNLDALEVYQLAGPDLTGTLIDSNKPISVFSGNQCANVPSRSSFCDHLVEQMPPVETWGQTILTIPLATRLNGDTFRILADEDGTIVSIIGIESEVIDLDSGEFAERILQGNNRIVANKPILVAQFSNGTSFDNVTSDPFMMLVPPSEQFLRSYTFATPGSGFSINFVNIVAETVDAVTEQVILNGLPVSAAEFQPIAASDFSVASLPLAIGKHTITSSSPSGIYVYGFANADSYGYPGGLGFAPGSVDTEPSLLVTSEEFTAQALSDWMEIQFAEISEGEGVNDDYDGDGNDNESEFAAGTNPRDAQSKLAIRSLEKRDGAWHVSWNSVPAKLYQIEARESLSDAWKTRVSHVRGANGEITESLIEEDNGLGACFYRIIVQP